MKAKSKPLLSLTAGDLMSRNVVPLPEWMPLRDAARLLRQTQVGRAPVVDAQGRCVGVLSAADFLRWAEKGGRDKEEVAIPVCPYQVQGRLLTGEAAVICTLAEGSCPLQVVRPTTGGRHTTLCTRSSRIPSDEEDFARLPSDAVRRYMTADIVTTGPDVPLPRLSRMMIDAHIHRVLVVDEEHRPIGIVTSTDLLAALASSDDEP